MEQTKKTQDVPAWVKIIQDFPEAVQNQLGNMCANTLQSLAMVALVSSELFTSLIAQVVHDLRPEIDAQMFVDELVKDALKND